MHSRTRLAALRAFTPLLTLALVASACSGDDDDTASGGSDTTAVVAAPSTTTVPCTGEPIKIMQMGAFDGAISFPHAIDGSQAAVEAVNASCELGRPLDLTICSDKFDSNVALECGRQAVDDGMLALVYSFTLVGEAGIQIATAAGIPHFGNAGVNTVDGTDPLSYPLGSAMTWVLGEVSAAAGLGKESVALVGPQSPTIQFVSTQVEAQAGRLGMDFAGWIPYEAGLTDFAPVAAQVTASGADAVVVLSSDPEVEATIEALVAEGIDFEQTAVFLPGPTVPQYVVDELGDAVEGLYLGDTSWPTNDRSNAGVDAMYEELESTGMDTSKVGSQVLGGWTAVHVLVDVLKTAPDINTIDSAALVELLKKFKVDRPEAAPVDWTKPAFSEAPLNAFRFSTSKALISRVVDGTVTVVTDGFVDVSEPIELNTP